MKKFVIDLQELKVAVDIVVISEQKNASYLLLIKRKYAPFENQWAIPGGFVRDHEELEAAALRELEEETGFKTAKHIQQIQAFGKVDRDPRKRVISIAYLIVTDELSNLNPEKGADNDTTEAQWFNLNELPLPLAFDHDEILKEALKKYKEKH